MNIPAFLTGRLTAQYGEETARRIAAGFEAGRKTTLRVNRLKAEPAQIAAALADAGISARRVPWSEDALVLEGAGEAAVAALPMFENGEIYMQSLSSMIPPLVLGAQAADLLPEFRHARVVRRAGSEHRQLRLLGRDLLRELG